MLEAQYVPEIDVLIAVAKWLHSEGWTLESLSVARGQGIDSVVAKNKLVANLTKLGIQQTGIRFVTRGEDIRARQGSTLWRIECKGLGTNLPLSTVRNNFDRALSSTVSYYTQKDGLRLGLALPEEYIKLIRDRIPQALRVAINLWILLYVSADDLVVEFAPDEKITTPSPS